MVPGVRAPIVLLAGGKDAGVRATRGLIMFDPAANEWRGEGGGRDKQLQARPREMSLAAFRYCTQVKITSLYHDHTFQCFVYLHLVAAAMERSRPRGQRPKLAGRALACSEAMRGYPSPHIQHALTHAIIKLCLKSALRLLSSKHGLPGCRCQHCKERCRGK